MKYALYLILGLTGLLTISCSDTKKLDTKVARFPDNELKGIFEKINKPALTFSINNTKDTVLLGEMGTTLIIPKDIFCDSNGSAITNVKIELVEALTVDDMIRNGLSTVSNSKILETDGMIFINALGMANEHLKIIEGKELFIETISLNNVPNIEIFNGNFNDNQIIDWGNSRAVNKYLTLVPLKYLDFYPDGFTSEDELSPQAEEKLESDSSMEHFHHSSYCGIPINLVESLANKEFENTLVSTKEFEIRMQYIHKSCSEELLKLYLSNIDLNLWEIDSLAFEMLKKTGNKQAESFAVFKTEKKTKVKDIQLKDKIYSSFLASTFDNNEQIKKRNELRRITTNSFSTTKLGWINCDRFMNEPSATPLKLEIIASNIDKSKLCKTYLVFQSHNSILDLSRYDNGIFHVGFANESIMELPKGEKVLIVSISNDGEKPLFSIQHFILGQAEQVKMILKPVTPEELTVQLRTFNKNPAPGLFKQSVESNCCDHAEKYADSLVQ
ncbi:MAG: cytochrome c, mono- and diheme variant family protein [Chitinophagaceae bacterium]|nr:cytochrome c, mono- and diheme variant family protein [Chitinophagaceae bacterium]